jgi:chromosome segregation ATPase
MADDNSESSEPLHGGDNNQNRNVEDRLQELIGKVAILERQKLVQDEQLLTLQKEMNETDVKHKEEVYWLQLELESARREKEAAEDRMAELYRDLREMTEEGQEELEDTQTPARTDTEYIVDLQERVVKYARTLGVLDNQLSMVKNSCDEVVKSLKEELEDVIEEKCRMEMDLLNQLAVLDNDKRDVEVEFDEQMRIKEEHINNLSQGIGVMNGYHGNGDSNKVDDLRQEITRLTEQTKKLEDELATVRAESSEKITHLEETNAEINAQIEKLTGDMDVMRQDSTAEAVQVLESLTRDRDETLAALERVANIWERADESVQTLEDVMDQIRPNDKNAVEGNKERLLSTLETASLLHGQIKVSLLLVELNLRNQLGALRNDKLQLGSTDVAAASRNFSEQVKEIQNEAMATISQVDAKLTAGIKQLEEATRSETIEMKDALLAKTEELKSLQATHAKLEKEIANLKNADEAKVNGHVLNGATGASSSVSREVLERLQSEVLKVVQRVKEKNEIIGRLNTCVEEHKMREQILKKELKRVMKKAKVMGEEESVKSAGNNKISPLMQRPPGTPKSSK